MSGKGGTFAHIQERTTPTDKVDDSNNLKD